MTRSESLAQAEESHDTQDSQAVLDAIRAELGVETVRISGRQAAGSGAGTCRADFWRPQRVSPSISGRLDSEKNEFDRRATAFDEQQIPADPAADIERPAAVVATPEARLQIPDEVCGPGPLAVIDKDGTGNNGM